MPEDIEAPPGFGPLFRSSPFLETIGPLFSRGNGGDMVIGLRAARKHCNARGLVHGGVLSTLPVATATLLAAPSSSVATA